MQGGTTCELLMQTVKLKLNKFDLDMITCTISQSVSIYG